MFTTRHGTPVEPRNLARIFDLQCEHSDVRRIRLHDTRHTFGLLGGLLDRTAESGRDDLRWRLDLAPTLQWTWAKTYADSAPHWYVVEGRTAGLTHDDYVRAGRVIRTFGEPGKFWSRSNLYLFTALVRCVSRGHGWCWTGPALGIPST